VAEPDAFERLALPHLAAVARFALSLTRNAADADDLVQETYLHAQRGWRTFDADGDCRRWLFAICRNGFLSGRRRQGRLVESDDGDIDALPAARGHALALAAGAANAFDRHDLLPAIEAAIAALPEPHHSILVLVDLEEQSYDSAAEILGVPVGTVRSRLFRARRLIQERLLAYAQDAGIRPAATPGGPDASRRRES